MSRRSSLIMFVLAMVLALLTTLVVMRQVSAWRSQSTTEQTEQVLVVVKAVPAHTVVSSADVALKPIARSAVAAGALSALDQAVGHYSVSQWYPGQQVLAPMLLDKSQPASFPLAIPAGKRAFTIGNDAVTGVDHFISPGDHVDILVTYKSKQDKGQIVKVLLQDVLVLYADNAPAPQATQVMVNGSSPSSGSGSNSQKGVDTLTLAVLPAEMAQLDYAQSFGQLHIALRNPNDTNSVPVPDVTAAQPGAQ